MSVKGCTCDAPSAACQAERSSPSVSGPNVVNVKRPARLQDARDLGEHGVDVLAPGQQQVAEDEVEAGIRHRDGLGLGAEPFDARARREPLRFGQHARRRVEREDPGLRPARGERGRAPARAAAEVERRTPGTKAIHSRRASIASRRRPASTADAS